mmetsp:Transcript_19326/g.58306  ORF Transcript_19326/g.58306 Transcript_19326/m.58306 type:complete len:106 (+) Transcript_19326:1249-1566(+)
MAVDFSAIPAGHLEETLAVHVGGWEMALEAVSSAVAEVEAKKAAKEIVDSEGMLAADDAAASPDRVELEKLDSQAVQVEDTEVATAGVAVTDSGPEEKYTHHAKD